jgi:high-affinity iron transporter
MSIALITFREGLEAAIIVGTLLSFIRALKVSKADLYVWLGVAIGLIASVVFAWVFNSFFGGFVGKNEKIYEGILMLVGGLMILQVSYWMKHNAKKYLTNLKSQIAVSIEQGTLFTIATIVALSVMREGVETVIFIEALQAQSDTALSLPMAIGGIVASILLAIALFFGSKKLPIKQIFSVSTTLLFMIAAGLLAHAVVEFQGAGWLPIIIKPLYDLSSVFSEKEGFGAILKGLFGYDANPSLIAVLVYWCVLLLGIWDFLRGKK